MLVLPRASVLDCRREERVQKACSVDHHGPGDARLSAVLNPLSHPECDYVLLLGVAKANLVAHGLGLAAERRRALVVVDATGSDRR